MILNRQYSKTQAPTSGGTLVWDTMMLKGSTGKLWLDIDSAGAATIADIASLYVKVGNDYWVKFDNSNQYLAWMQARHKTGRAQATTEKVLRIPFTPHINADPSFPMPWDEDFQLPPGADIELSITFGTFSASGEAMSVGWAESTQPPKGTMKLISKAAGVGASESPGSFYFDSTGWLVAGYGYDTGSAHVTKSRLVQNGAQISDLNLALDKIRDQGRQGAPIDPCFLPTPLVEILPDRKTVLELTTGASYSSAHFIIQELRKYYAA